MEAVSAPGHVDISPSSLGKYVTGLLPYLEKIAVGQF